MSQVLVKLEQSVTTSNRGARGHFNPSFDLTVAYHQARGASNVAKALSLSIPSVRRSMIMIAQSRLELQMMALRDLVQRAKACPPLALMEYVQWDTAKIRMTIPLRTEFDQDPWQKNEESSWDIMSSRKAVTLLWPNGAVELEIIAPPVAMTDTGGSSLASALNHEHLRGVHAQLEQLKNLAKISASIRGADGAFPNEKYLACEAGTTYAAKSAGSGPRTETGHRLHSALRCGNHIVHSVEECLTGIAYTEITSTLFSMSSFMRMGGYYHRWRAALPIVPVHTKKLLKNIVWLTFLSYLP
jgi:hypothetical protein